MRGLLAGCWLLLCLPALLQAASWHYLSADQAPDSNQAVLLLVIDSEVELGSLLLRGPSGLIRLRPAARRQQRLATQPDEGGEHALLLLELPPGEYRIERIDQLSPAGRVAPGAVWQTPFLLRAVIDDPASPDDEAACAAMVDELLALQAEHLPALA